MPIEAGGNCAIQTKNNKKIVVITHWIPIVVCKDYSLP